MLVTVVRQVALVHVIIELSQHTTAQLACADVYERLTPKGKPPTFFTLVVTQLVSGVWHGLFPGYVLFFISSALMFQSSKVLYRYERNWPKQVQNFPLWTLAKWAYTAFCLNYCASAFMVSCPDLSLSAADGNTAFKSAVQPGSCCRCVCFLIDCV